MKKVELLLDGFVKSVPPLLAVIQGADIYSVESFESEEGTLQDVIEIRGDYCDTFCIQKGEPSYVACQGRLSILFDVLVEGFRDGRIVWDS